MQAGSGNPPRDIDYADLARRIKAWGVELGFAKLGITDTDLAEDEARLLQYLAKGRQGKLAYLERHGTLRSRPAELVPGTLRVISARMDYFPRGLDAAGAWHTLGDGSKAYLSRFALGRDYHKLVRRRLQKLADRIETDIGPFGYRAFCDSAPVLEKALARKAGLGWVGKHTLVLDKDVGSWFFLGELFVDLPLPIDQPVPDYCGTCTKCIDVCPTHAIIGPHQLDARRCISYQTIENKGAIDEDLRPLIGNRVFGCDDCQLVCPWNKYARPTREEAFAPRHGLDGPKLVELFAWTEDEFREATEGMPIRRAGYAGFMRNVAVALGNAPWSEAVVAALRRRRDDPSPLVREHVAWALRQQAGKAPDDAHAADYATDPE